MAIRATAALVGGIIEVDATISLTPFIAAANALVEEIAVESEHTEARLTLIETWLAAHFYAMRDPRPVSEGAGGVSTSYQSSVSLYLATSHHGQMAMTLDTSGLLAGLSGSAETAATAGAARTASVSWVGNEEDQGLVETE